MLTLMKGDEVSEMEETNPTASCSRMEGIKRTTPAKVSCDTLIC